VREITAYAAARGIEVIPALDMPGHSSAIIAAYPELSCDGKAIEVPGAFGVLDNIICIGNDSAMEFMAGIVHNICDLTGAKTFHIGFDEVKLDHLKTCPKCRAKMKALGLTKVEELKAYAKDYFLDSLKKRGIEVIIFNDGMDKADTGVVCYYWLPFGKHRKNIVSWVNQGQKAIIAPTSHCYMDYPYVWTSLKKTFSLNPVLPGIEKPENIIGVEAPVWTEYIEDHEKLAFCTYYRMAALSEIGWHGKGESYADFMQNLRAREEYYFGERLDTPERVLNPGLLTRLRLAKKCMTDDMSYEFKQYKSRKAD
jgi:hexosaminidase